MRVFMGLISEATPSGETRDDRVVDLDAGDFISRGEVTPSGETRYEMIEWSMR